METEQDSMEEEDMEIDHLENTDSNQQENIEIDQENSENTQPEKESVSTNKGHICFHMSFNLIFKNKPISILTNM
jgi:hypothetical protein